MHEVKIHLLLDNQISLSSCRSFARGLCSLCNTNGSCTCLIRVHRIADTMLDVMFKSLVSAPAVAKFPPNMIPTLFPQITTNEVRISFGLESSSHGLKGRNPPAAVDEVNVSEIDVLSRVLFQKAYQSFGCSCHAVYLNGRKPRPIVP